MVKYFYRVQVKCSEKIYSLLITNVSLYLLKNEKLRSVHDLTSKYNI